MHYPIMWVRGFVAKAGQARRRCPYHVAGLLVKMARLLYNLTWRAIQRPVAGLTGDDTSLSGGRDKFPEVFFHV